MGFRCRVTARPWSQSPARAQGRGTGRARRVPCWTARAGSWSRTASATGMTATTRRSSPAPTTVSGSRPSPRSTSRTSGRRGWSARRSSAPRRAAGACTCAARARESKHWWIDALEADDLEGLAAAEPRTAFAGDERTGVKDPLVRRANGRWEAWICCHPLDEPGAEDRMSSAYATSDDGLDWKWHGTVLAGRPGCWDARGARLTSRPSGRAREL